jgi:hypothetical protein
VRARCDGAHTQAPPLSDALPLTQCLSVLVDVARAVLLAHKQKLALRVIAPSGILVRACV